MMTLKRWRYGLAAAVAIALGLLSIAGLSVPWAQGQSSCTVTVKSGESIQKAIDTAKAGAVLCLEQGTWNEGLLIYKGLTILGAGLEKTVINGLVWVGHLAAQVALQGVQINGSLIVLTDLPVQLALQEVQVSSRHANSVLFIGPGVLSLVSASISGGAFGLTIYGQVTANIVDSQIADAALRGILVLSDDVHLSVINSRVVRSQVGISIGMAEQKSRLSLVDSIISDNGWRGLLIGGSSKAEIIRSTVENNGTDQEICALAICPGIEVSEESETTIIESKILNNTDWGLAAYLAKCGYSEDRFTGKVTIDDKTVIEGNNKAGKYQGEVCLP
jgi:multisubunit Na+/H+ antiporter MnhB subunit